MTECDVRPQPWHSEALRLLSDGCTQKEVSRRLGVGRMALYFFLMTPERREEHRARCAKKQREWSHREPLDGGYVEPPKPVEQDTPPPGARFVPRKPARVIPFVAKRRVTVTAAFCGDPPPGRREMNEAHSALEAPKPVNNRTYKWA